MNRSRLTIGLSLVLTLALAPIAWAHPGHDHGSGFSAGVMHPFSGIDHILAMIAVGVLAAQIGGRAIWLLPATFLALMVCGGSSNLAGMNVPLVEQGIMVSVLVLGMLIAIAGKVPLPAMMALVGLFAIFHGYAHVAEMNAGHSPALYAMGFVIATATLHVAGIGIGLLAQRVGSATFIRIGGAAIAACGLLLFMHILEG